MAGSASIDRVSLADLLRNSFVYPAHTIYSDVKILTTGFAAHHGTQDELHFHFPDQSASATFPCGERRRFAALIPSAAHAIRPAMYRAREGAVVFAKRRQGSDVRGHCCRGCSSGYHLPYVARGREENEVESARFVARRFGLRHEALVCNLQRAYDRYLAMIPRMPLSTADFAMLSYADLATEMGHRHGDGIIDAVGILARGNVPVAA